MPAVILEGPLVATLAKTRIENLSLLFRTVSDCLRPVSFRIHNTEKTEWFIGWISQLMGLVGFDIESIKEADFVFFPARNADAVSPDSYDNMFMCVHFETAESVRGDLEVSQVEFCRFAMVANQGLSDNISPFISFRFVSFGLYPLPGEGAFVFAEPRFVER